MARSSVRPAHAGKIQGASLEERIASAIDLVFAGNRSRFAKAVGRDRRLIHDWIDGTKQPSAESIARIAQVVRDRTGGAVTIEEILGVQVGQDPPFAAWHDFLATPEGGSMTAGERRGLQSLAWPPGRAPTVGAYQIALAALRATTERVA